MKVYIQKSSGHLYTEAPGLTQRADMEGKEMSAVQIAEYNAKLRQDRFAEARKPAPPAQVPEAAYTDTGNAPDPIPAGLPPSTGGDNDAPAARIARMSESELRAFAAEKNIKLHPQVKNVEKIRAAIVEALIPADVPAGPVSEPQE